MNLNIKEWDEDGSLRSWGYWAPLDGKSPRGFSKNNYSLPALCHYLIKCWPSREEIIGSRPWCQPNALTVWSSSIIPTNAKLLLNMQLYDVMILAGSYGSRPDSGGQRDLSYTGYGEVVKRSNERRYHSSFLSALVYSFVMLSPNYWKGNILFSIAKESRDSSYSFCIKGNHETIV